MGAVAPPLQDHHLLIGHYFREFAEGGVEALDVTHLQQAPGFVCSADQCCCFVLTGSDRLLDQHMQTGFQAGQADWMVQQGRHGNANGLHLAEHRAVVSEPTAAELLHRQGTAIAIGISHTHKISIFQEAQHPGVMPAHVSNADDPDLDRTHGVGRHRQAGVIAGRLSGFSPLLRTHPGGPVAPVQSGVRPWR